LLTPAFYGCYDWHSAVHAHWLLARVARLFPERRFAAEARAALSRNITAANIQSEARYMNGEDRATFERPYGLAWLLTLAAELRLLDRRLASTLAPLEKVAAKHLFDWLPKLPYPDRSGQHANTAFALALAFDWARDVRARDFRQLIRARARDFYSDDEKAPIAFEPSGEDFLSPALAEADLMRRILGRHAFAKWFAAFMPDVVSQWPVPAPYRADGKLAHLDGLNLSRAWMLKGISAALPSSNPAREICAVLAQLHADAGLAAVTGENYVGGHWLGTFAVYLLTR